METRLINAQSFHPILSITLPATLFSSISHQCTPNVLVHMPAGIFYDAFTAHHTMNQTSKGKGKGKQKDRRWNIVQLTNHVELEQAVGWSARTKHANADIRAQWWERKHSDNEHERLQRRMYQTVQDALRESANHYLDNSAENDARPTGITRPRSSGEIEKEQQREEVSTLLIELLAADGFQTRSDITHDFEVRIPLHLRYHPPSLASNLISTTTMQPLQASQASSSSSYLTLLSEILPKSLLHLFPFSFPSPFSFNSSLSPFDYDSVVHTTLSTPRLYLSCSTSSHYISGYYSTTLGTLFPNSHTHLLAPSERHTTVLALSHSNANTSNSSLVVQIPIPPAILLAPVQLITFLTVFTAALTIIYHLLTNIIPLVQAAESTL